MSWFRYKKKPSDKENLLMLGIAILSIILVFPVGLILAIVVPSFLKEEAKWVFFLYFSIGCFFVILYTLISVFKESNFKEKIILIILSYILYFSYIFSFVALATLKLFKPPEKAITNAIIFLGFCLLTIIPVFIFNEEYLKKKKYGKRKKKVVNVSERESKGKSKESSENPAK